MATKRTCNWCGVEIITPHYYVVLPNGRKVVLTATVRDVQGNGWNNTTTYIPYDLCLNCMFAFMVDCLNEEENGVQ